MSQLIVVADAGRARFFVWGRATEGEPRGTIEEVEDDPAPGAATALPTGAGSGKTGFLPKTDKPIGTASDHRRRDIKSSHADFARDITGAAGRIRSRVGAYRVVMCASPTFLGQLRKSYRSLGPDGMKVEELPKDLSKMDRETIRGRLVEAGFTASEAASG